MSTRAERAARRAKQNDERHENERVYKAMFNSLFEPDDEEIIDVVTVDDTLPESNNIPPPKPAPSTIPKPKFACGTCERDVPLIRLSDFPPPPGHSGPTPNRVISPTLVVPQPANIAEALDYRDMPALEPNKN